MHNFGDTSGSDTSPESIWRPTNYKSSLVTLESIIPYETAWSKCYQGFFCNFQQFSNTRPGPVLEVFSRINGTQILNFLEVYDKTCAHKLQTVPLDAFVYATYDANLGEIILDHYVKDPIKLAVIPSDILKCIVICVWEALLQIENLEYENNHRVGR